MQLYTVTEAAPLLGLSRSSLYRLVAAKRVPHSIDATFGRVRFTEDDIDAARKQLGRLEHQPAVA